LLLGLLWSALLLHLWRLAPALLRTVLYEAAKLLHQHLDRVLTLRLSLGGWRHATLRLGRTTLLRRHAPAGTGRTRHSLRRLLAARHRGSAGDLRVALHELLQCRRGKGIALLPLCLVADTGR
jgi:hypothetical protein